MAHAMGITSPLTGFPSEVLGAVAVSPLEMADAYATIAAYGVHHDPTAISRVVFGDGSVTNLGDTPSRRVFTSGEAYAAIKVMKTVITSGTGTAADYGCPAAGKTGTTSSFTDAYFDGFSPQLTTAVWVGYPNSTISMNDVNGLGQGFGGTLAAPIWHDYMQQASNGYCSDFQQPSTYFSGTPFFGRFATTGNNRRRWREHRQHAATRATPAAAAAIPPPTRTTTPACTPIRRSPRAIPAATRTPRHPVSATDTRRAPAGPGSSTTDLAPPRPTPATPGLSPTPPTRCGRMY